MDCEAGGGGAEQRRERGGRRASCWSEAKRHLKRERIVFGISLMSRVEQQKHGKKSVLVKSDKRVFYMTYQIVNKLGIIFSSAYKKSLDFIQICALIDNFNIISWCTYSVFL